MAAQAAPPHLEKQGSTQQLIVDGKPFLILGGELGNSSASSADYMRPHWPRLQGDESQHRARAGLVGAHRTH